MTTVELPSYDLPLRAADIDILHHVNNVMYLDYAAEARALLADDDRLPGDRHLAHITIDFGRPLLLSRRPVTIANALRDEFLLQDICHEDDGERTVFAHLETTFGPTRHMNSTLADAQSYPARVRRADLGQDGFVTAAKMFELFQEGRTLFVRDILSAADSNRFVIARVDVEFGTGLRWRREPYASRSRLTRLGTSSLDVVTEIVDGDTVHARATTVVVGFDVDTQRSRQITDHERSVLTPALRPL